MAPKPFPKLRASFGRFKRVFRRVHWHVVPCRKTPATEKDDDDVFAKKKGDALHAKRVTVIAEDVAVQVGNGQRKKGDPSQSAGAKSFDLPYETVLAIFMFLDIPELLRVAQVCSNSFEICLRSLNTCDIGVTILQRHREYPNHLACDTQHLPVRMQDARPRRLRPPFPLTSPRTEESPRPKCTSPSKLEPRISKADHARLAPSQARQACPRRSSRRTLLHCRPVHDPT